MLTTKKVLIIDEDKYTRMLCLEMFRGDEYIVKFATDGVDALTRLYAADFDLAVIDCQYGIKGNLDLFGIVKSMNAGISKKAVFLTNTEHASVLEKSEVRYLVKPWSIANLKKLVGYLADNELRPGF